MQKHMGVSGFDVACNEHKVCGSNLNASAPDGPCYCCTLELQVGFPSLPHLFVYGSSV